MVTQTVKLTVSLPKGLISVTDEIAREENISRSKVVSNCLNELVKKRKMQLMEEGYKLIAEENSDFAKLTFALQGEVALKQD